MALTIITILICLATLTFYGCKTFYVPDYEGPITDHFDGKKFYNPGGNEMGSFKELFRYQLKNKSVKWPDLTDSLYQKTDLKTKVDNDIRFKQINHATVLIQHAGLNIITDPVFSKRASPFSFMGPKRKRNPSVKIDDLPPIDVILISHDHYDHLDVKAIQFITSKYNSKVLVGLGLKNFLEKFDIKNIEELDWEESIYVNDVKFTFYKSKHWSNRFASPYKTLWGSWFIKSPEKHIYFAGDTAYDKHFNKIKENFPPIDLALIPIGAYVPRSFMKYVHMDPQEALQAHLDLNPKISLAIHWGTFKLTGESMYDPIEELQESMDSLNITNFLYDKNHNQYYSFDNY